MRTQVAITFYMDLYYYDIVQGLIVMYNYVCVYIHNNAKSQVAPTFNYKAESITNINCYT